MAVEEVASAAAPGTRRMRLSGVVAGLTAAKVAGAASGFITGPLLARALGASGRGDLAAVIVPVTIAPVILGLGLPALAYRELPRGRPVGEVIGSLGLPLMVIGLLTMGAAVPIADLLAGGRETVHTLLVIGFLLMPVLCPAGLLYAGLASLERWRAFFATTLIPFAVPFVGIVVFYVLGGLTVASAAAVMVAGSLLSIVPGLRLLRSRPIFRPSLAREGLSFGVKSWLGGLAQLANLRLDQLVMITVVAPRELGLYAVATTISGASGLMTGALGPPLMTRVASQGTSLVPQAVRVTLAATVGLNLALGLITPTLLSLLFGSQFRSAAAMAIILLAANVPFAGASVLSSAIQADGAPLIPSIAEGMALVVTVVGLLILLRPFGGLGAAAVSFGAYATSFVFQLVIATRRTGVPFAEFLVPTLEDVRWARRLLSVAVLRLRVAL